MKYGNTGGPAFPTNGWQDGMDLRDYFAAKAMQGFISAKAWHPDFVYPEDYKFGAGSRADASVAQASYKYADAMLEARDAHAHNS